MFPLAGTSTPTRVTQSHHQCFRFQPHTRISTSLTTSTQHRPTHLCSKPMPPSKVSHSGFLCLLLISSCRAHIFFPSLLPLRTSAHVPSSCCQTVCLGLQTNSISSHLTAQPLRRLSSVIINSLVVLLVRLHMILLRDRRSCLS